MDAEGILALIRRFDAGFGLGGSMVMKATSFDPAIGSKTNLHAAPPQALEAAIAKSSASSALTADVLRSPKNALHLIPRHSNGDLAQLSRLNRMGKHEEARETKNRQHGTCDRDFGAVFHGIAKRLNDPSSAIHARERSIATGAHWPGSLKRMVFRPQVCHIAESNSGRLQTPGHGRTTHRLATRRSSVATHPLPNDSKPLQSASGQSRNQGQRRR